MILVASSRVLLEEAFNHMDDELHRRVVIVQDQDAVHVRPFRLRAGARDDHRAVLVVVPTIVAGRHARFVPHRFPRDDVASPAVSGRLSPPPPSNPSER
jgi:hypothetical protein